MSTITHLTQDGVLLLTQTDPSNKDFKNQTFIFQAVEVRNFT